MKLGKRRIRRISGERSICRASPGFAPRPADLAAESGEPAAGGVEHLAPAVEAPLDRDGDARELADALVEAAQPRKLARRPGRATVEVADGAQRLDRLGQLLGLEHAALLGSPREMADVVQAAERRPQARAERFDHLGRQRLAVVDLAGVEARLHAVAAAAFPSEQAARAATSARTLSNSSSSSVCVSMSPHDRAVRALAAVGRQVFGRDRALTDTSIESPVHSRQPLSQELPPIHPWRVEMESRSTFEVVCLGRRNTNGRRESTASG